MCSGGPLRALDEVAEVRAVQYCESCSKDCGPIRLGVPGVALLRKLGSAGLIIRVAEGH